MNYYKLNAFNNFRCVGSDCPETCCGHWKIPIDAKTAEYYYNLEGTFGDKLRQNISFENEETVFQLLPNGKCPFLNDQSLCSIYIEIGEEHLCDICKQYPRSYESLTANDMLCHMSISCPVASEMFFTSHNLSISALQNGETRCIDSTLSNHVQDFINGLLISLQIIQSEALSPAESLKLGIFFNDMLESTLSAHKNPVSLFQDFSSEAAYRLLISQLNAIQPDFEIINTTLENILGSFSLLLNMPYLRQTSIAILDEIKNNTHSGQKGDLCSYITFSHSTNLASIKKMYIGYLIYSYYGSAFSDNRPVHQLTYVLLLHLISSLFIGYELKQKKQLADTQIFHLYAKITREIKHAEEIKNGILEYATSVGIDDTKEILKLII